MDQRPDDHVIYKGKAAIQFTLKKAAPKEITTKRGKYIATNKGCIFVAGANAVPDKDVYDWGNKVTLGLNEHEVAKFMVGLKGVTQEFYHDPGKGKSNEGEVVKKLRIQKASSGDLLFINLSMKRGDKTTKIEGVPITKEEAAGLHALLSAAIPKILGWT